MLSDAFDCARGYVTSGHIATAVVAVAEGGRDADVRAFGADGGEEPSLVNRQFALASITKAITGAAVARAWQCGKLDYDEPICEIVPELASDDLRRKITIRHVLTHTTGLPSRFASACAAADYSHDSVMNLLYREDPVAHEPGTMMAYSSYTYQLINALVACKLGMGMTAFLNEYLFEPLGMTGTAFKPASWDEAVTTVDHPVPFGESMDRYCSLEMTGSGLWSTVHDLLALGNAFVAPSAFLTKDTLAKVTETTLSAPKGTEGERSARTLGWVKANRPEFPTQPASGFYHGGATGTLLWVDPERHLVFVFLTNRWGSGNEHAFDILSRLY